MRVLVVGASGSVGRELVPLLIEAGADVRALARRPVALGREVEWVAGDLQQRLIPALADVDAVFLLWPGFTADGSDAVVDAIAARAAHVVYLSSEPAGADPRTVWGTIEARIAAAGVDWTVLRPTGFAKNTLLWAEQIPSGVVEWPFGKAARSLVDERDIAAVAARALLERHSRQTHVISGPEALTQAEQVRLIGEAIGRPLRWREQPRAAARDALADVFGDAYAADAVLDTWERFITEPEIVTATVEAVTGRPARSFADWARAHAGAFRP